MAFLTNDNYEKLVPIVRDGDIIMFRGKKHNFLQRMIMFGTHSKFYHCGMLFWLQVPGKDIPMLMVVEAQGGSKRRIVNLGFYRNANIEILRGLRPWSEVASEAFEGLGIAEYSWIEAAYSGIHDFMFRYFGCKLPRWKFSGEICSEFIARLERLPTVDTVSPADMYIQLLEQGSEIVVN